MKFKIITFGCKVNIYESEIIKEKFLDKNNFYDEFNPDLIIINTCSVTNIADKKAMRMIRKMRRENPQVILVVCGCAAENHKENIMDLNINILIGNKDKSNLVNIVEKYLENKEFYIKFYDNKKLEFEDMQVSRFSTHTRAFIKIQDGCDNYCAYCIIPYMRGNIRFKDFGKCLEEAQELVKNGHKEIVLTGIHTGSYGRGCVHNLVDLIEEISKIDNLMRIRISSIEITEINDEFLNMLKTNDIVCNHLHIPLQSGNDKILKLMNRKYNTKYFVDKIKEIRKIKPNISITTDVIVGFPNETEDDFNITYNFCKNIKFAKIHVFPFSKRNGTKAFNMDNQVDEGIKKQRSRALVDLSNSLQMEYCKQFIGENLDVLIEENDNSSIGFSSNYIKIKVNKKLEHNQIYKVKILKNTGSILIAEEIGLKNMVGHSII